MRAAVLGQGSIGRRHATLLLEAGHEVVAFDPVTSPGGSVPGVRRTGSEAEALAEAQVAIVASPSSEHLRQARLAVEAGVHVLVEKPLATEVDGAAELVGLAAAGGVVLGVAMNLRFHPGVTTLRRLLDEGAIGRVLRAEAWCGSWLPGWRPGIDYRQTYSARRELGGGVLLDAVHELDYLTWLLGPVTAVTATMGTVSDLELDVEDVALVQLELASGALASVSLDYLDRSYHRGARLVGSEATAQWRWEDGLVTVGRGGDDVERYDAAGDVADTYRAEQAAFLEAVRSGAPPPVPAADGLRTVQLVDAVRLAAAEGRRVALAA